MIEKQNPKNDSTKERISLVVKKLGKVYDERGQGFMIIKKYDYK